MEGESDLRFWNSLADQMHTADHDVERIYGATLSGLRLQWDWRKRRASRSLVSCFVTGRAVE